jgi:hypothetical protein
MVDEVENYAKFEVRTMVRFLQAGVSQISVYGQNIFSKKEVPL